MATNTFLLVTLFIIFLSTNTICTESSTQHERASLEGGGNVGTESKNDTVETKVHVHSSNAEKNDILIRELEKLVHMYKARGDQWRAFSYRKAVDAIRKYNKPITSYLQAKTVTGIGLSVAHTVEQILYATGLNNSLQIDKDEVLERFRGVWGAGPINALNWYNQGFKTIDDLKNHANLSPYQVAGVKYYNDFNVPMLREEVEEIATIVMEAALKIDSNLRFTICGSYRRGKENCNDVDVVITKAPNTTDNLLYLIHEVLLKKGFITDDLTHFTSYGTNERRYLGVCKLPGKNQLNRRFDVIAVPEQEEATAIFRYTGSAKFQKYMRLLATRQGMKLSDRGLAVDVVREGPRIVDQGTILHTPTEESIFEHLGIKYKPPEEREDYIT